VANNWRRDNLWCWLLNCLIDAMAELIEIGGLAYCSMTVAEGWDFTI